MDKTGLLREPLELYSNNKELSVAKVEKSTKLTFVRHFFPDVNITPGVFLDDSIALNSPANKICTQLHDYYCGTPAEGIW